VNISTAVSQIFDASLATAWEVAIDSSQFPSFFDGFVLIPAVEKIELFYENPKVGGKRKVHNSDGSILDEEILVFSPQAEHSYQLSGFRFPFSWMVATASGSWVFEQREDKTLVSWTYRFTTASWLLAPITYLVVHIFFRTAMARCLKKMADYCQESH